MSDISDPKRTIVGLLKNNWDSEGVGFTPTFSIDWYDAKLKIPQVVVRNITEIESELGLNADRSFNTATYGVHAFSTSQRKRWKMIREIRRIINVKRLSPGGGLTVVDFTGWRDLDETMVSPPVYHSAAEVRLLYFAVTV